MKVCENEKWKVCENYQNMRQRQRVGKSVGKNSADRLAWCRVPQNFQLVKGCNFCKEQ